MQERDRAAIEAAVNAGGGGRWLSGSSNAALAFGANAHIYFAAVYALCRLRYTRAGSRAPVADGSGYDGKWRH